MIIEYGTFKLDTDSAPQASLRSLLSKGMAHSLGNEARSKAIASLRRQALIVAGHADADKSVKDAFLASYDLPATDSPEYIEAVNAAQSAVWEAIQSGTLGEASSRGPQRDPVEVEFDKIVKSEVIDVLKGQKMHKGAKHPSMDDVFTFADKQSLTFAELLDRWAKGKDKKSGKPNADRIRKEAEGIVRARAKRAEAAAESANDVESLGF